MMFGGLGPQRCLFLLFCALFALEPAGKCSKPEQKARSSLKCALVAVKRESFKTCEQSGFCRRNRAYADAVTSLGSSWTSPYAIDPSTIKVKNGKLTGTVLKTIGESQAPVELPLAIQFREPGVARITIDEAKRRKGDIELRHNSQARKERYDEVEKWALIGQGKLDSAAKERISTEQTTVSYGPGNKYKAIIRHQPFSIDFLRDGEVQVKLNGNGLLNYEHWRKKLDKPQKETTESTEDGQETPKPEGTPEATEEEETEDESTWWEESFGGNTDSKPKGPESVGIDITFPNYGHVYGIPGHTGPLSLKETR